MPYGWSSLSKSAYSLMAVQYHAFCCDTPPAMCICPTLYQSGQLGSQLNLGGLIKKETTRSSWYTSMQTGEARKRPNEKYLYDITVAKPERGNIP
ncbi:hypothetical protein llap_4973 [Limosa lapponica baueri]|uniref:Uncharacterized protein n=1 Tax=Limosa lapponica baueri TaxID=1758121 RepID=A0A2I0UF80_LIMLA|nr:hypothetical protein llap_4973 [Limosa lapponica baueri]